MAKVLDKLLGAIGVNVDDEYIEEYEDDDAYVGEESARRGTRKSNVIDFPTKNGQGVQMALIKAKSFSEVERIAHNLKEKRSVIVNFDEMDQSEAQRTIDFLSGTAFALEGSVQKLSQCTIVFAVGQVDLVGRIEEPSKEKSGLFGLF